MKDNLEINTQSNLAEIYDQALSMLKKGASEQQVLAKFSDSANELSPLLKTTSQFLAVPKNIVPTPLMQRKYIKETPKAFYHLSRFATFTLVVSFIVSGVVATGFAANQSSPGEALFAVKKTTEKLPLVFAISQDARASLEVHLTEKRFLEAQMILNDPSKNEEQKTAVLNELASQTSVAVLEVSQATKDNPNSESNQPLLSSLDKISKQQQELIKQIEPDSPITVAASKALETLNETPAQISEIKNTVAVADSDQALAVLGSKPDSVVVLGQITKIEDKQITVEKTVFTLTSETTIQNLRGASFSRSDLSKNLRVSVSGTKDKNNVLTATSIVITQTGVVESETTTNTSSTPIIEPTRTPEAETPPTQTDANNASASYILEDPAPQFIE